MTIEAILLTTQRELKILAEQLKTELVMEGIPNDKANEMTIEKTMLIEHKLKYRKIRFGLKSEAIVYITWKTRKPHRQGLLTRLQWRDCRSNRISQ